MAVESRVRFLRIFSGFMESNQCPFVAGEAVKRAASAVHGGQADDAVFNMLRAAIGIKRRRGKNKNSSAILGIKKGLMQYEAIELSETTEDEVRLVVVSRLYNMMLVKCQCMRRIMGASATSPPTAARSRRW